MYLCQAVHVGAAAGILPDIQGSPWPNGQRARLHAGQQIIHLLLKYLQRRSVLSTTAGTVQPLLLMAGWLRKGLAASTTSFYYTSAASSLHVIL